MRALIGTVALLSGLLIGSLIEYWAHRLMHAGLLLRRTHAEHHATDRAKGVIPEFLHYVLGVTPILPLGFLWSRPAGWGWLVGCVGYAFFSAYGHQLQHDNPAACFWLRGGPIHYFHHRLGLQRTNFGLALDCWDRLFRTYQAVPAGLVLLPQKDPRGVWAVRWWGLSEHRHQREIEE